MEKVPPFISLYMDAQKGFVAVPPTIRMGRNAFHNDAFSSFFQPEEPGSVLIQMDATHEPRFMFKKHMDSIAEDQYATGKYHRSP